MPLTLFALSLFAPFEKHPAYREPAPHTLRRLAQGDFVAIVRFLGHDEGRPNVPIRSRGSQSSMTFAADRYSVVESNQADAPGIVHLVRPNPPRRSVWLSGGGAPRPEPNPRQTFLLVGHRAVDGTLRGGDFDPRGWALLPDDTFDTADDDVAVERLEPTAAPSLAGGETPAERYVATRLLSLSSRREGDGGGDAKFFFEAVRELGMVGARYGLPNDVAFGVRAYPELAKGIRKAAEVRFPLAATLDERIFLASTLCAMGGPSANG